MGPWFFTLHSVEFTCYFGAFFIKNNIEKKHFCKKNIIIAPCPGDRAIGGKLARSGPVKIRLAQEGLDEINVLFSF